MRKNETLIQRKIQDYLRSIPNCWFMKEHGGVYGAAGVPDLLCCVCGRFVALEVKTGTGKPSALQLVAIGRINRAGGVAAVVRSVAEAKKVVETVCKS